MRNLTRLAGLALIGAAFMLIVAASFVPASRAAPPGQDAGQGAALFQQYCVGCHTIGGGVLVGPDLQGVTTRRTPDWLLKWIADPPGMIAQKDPTAVQLAGQYQTQMPTLGLSQADVNALIGYLSNPTPTTNAAGAAAPVAPVQIIPGDPVNGRALLVGAVSLQNGGPACIGCHTVAGVGELGGGALGPDLTGAFAKYGEQGLANFLNTYPLPTMKAVWTTIPLAPQEQADLRVFLQQAGASPPPANPALLLAGIGAAGGIVLLALAQFYWRKRLLGVRRPLLRRVLRERARVRPAPHA